ncbi:uncharacterized protein CCOS01_16932 [Colletotrichum costaricense]|uniref:Uncharacterized protein n=1 Tax=Colletotrichum costaricense TaxID=1209916 RepID=A0AAI9YEM8_9PEZI|nr:uncharacterized protein CCOS01_16932 [Colletotrichum costaricense]KAK1503857.1 hypothetical protein CCOS01_16932 [Colletotrichum costaricense]
MSRPKESLWQGRSAHPTRHFTPSNAALAECNYSLTLNGPSGLLPTTIVESAPATSRPAAANDSPEEPGRSKLCYDSVSDLGWLGGNDNLTIIRELKMETGSSPNEPSLADAADISPCFGHSHRTGSGALRCHSPPHNKVDIDTSNCACPEKLTIYKKLTCEDRRIELCRTFDERRFDAMIYGQPDALPPPHGVFVGTGPASVGAAGAVKKTYRPSYMRVDPRIHWSHNRSDKWFEQRMKEIKARGGRKTNFGKAAHRMRVQRIATEGREAEDALMRAPTKGQDRIPLLRSKPPEPWSHHRSMDFGDVPAHELPRYVQENESWMRAAKWMRESREVYLQAAKLEADHEPWEHLFRKRR